MLETNHSFHSHLDLGLSAGYYPPRSSPAPEQDQDGTQGDNNQSCTRPGGEEHSDQHQQQGKEEEVEEEEELVSLNGVESHSSDTTTTNDDDSSYFDPDPLPVSMPLTGSALSAGKSCYMAFTETRSRVIRLFNLPHNARSVLKPILSPSNSRQKTNGWENGEIPVPVSAWTLREEWGGSRVGEEGSIWIVFRTHEEAAAFLQLSVSPVTSVATALERDLEPLSKLRRFACGKSHQSQVLYNARQSNADCLTRTPPSFHSSPSSSSSMLRSSLSSPNLRIYNSVDATRMLPLRESDSFDRSADGYLSFPLVDDLLGQSSSHTAAAAATYVLSSNPPEKSIRFRLGDWVCESSSGSGGGCGAHNFSRNERCIGCGRSRPCISPPPVYGNDSGVGQVSPDMTFSATNTLGPTGERNHVTTASTLMRDSVNNTGSTSLHHGLRTNQTVPALSISSGIGGPSNRNDNTRFSALSTISPTSSSSMMSTLPHSSYRVGPFSTQTPSMGGSTLGRSYHRSSAGVQDSCLGLTGMTGNGGVGLDRLQSRERSRFFPTTSNISGELEDFIHPHSHSLPATPTAAAGGAYPPSTTYNAIGSRPIPSCTGSGSSRIAPLITNGASQSGTIIHTSSPSSGTSQGAYTTHLSSHPNSQIQQSQSPIYPLTSGARSNVNMASNNPTTSLSALQALLASTTYAQRVTSSTNHQANTNSYLSSTSPRTNNNGMGPAHSLAHILTPSGHALAVGGRVRNIAAPSSPSPQPPSTSLSSSSPPSCIMWWPDNEPLPHPSQIRPHVIGLSPAIVGINGAGGNLPPIMNTGNKGPIESQPGDWHCGVCGYLNWRRRKVCGTCFPFAEGNLDGVNPSVQTERVAALLNVWVKKEEEEEKMRRLRDMEIEMVEAEVRLRKERERNDNSESYFIRTAPVSGIGAAYAPGERPWTSSGPAASTSHQRTPRHAQSTEFRDAVSGIRQHSHIVSPTVSRYANSGTTASGLTSSTSASLSGGSGSGSDSSPLSSPSLYWNLGFDRVASSQSRVHHQYTSSIDSAASTSFFGPHLPAFLTKEDVNEDLVPAFSRADVDLTLKKRNMMDGIKAHDSSTTAEGNKTVGEPWSSRQRVPRVRTTSSSDDDVGSTSTPPPASPASATFSGSESKTFGFKFNFDPSYGSNCVEKPSSSSTNGGLASDRELEDGFNALTIRRAHRLHGKP